MFFLAQAEYSYLSADFRLKILLYFSPKKKEYIIMILFYGVGHFFFSCCILYVLFIEVIY